VLGVLPADVKQSIEDISVRSQERLQAYLNAQRQQGKAGDPAEVARLRQQTRDELAHVLTPPQLEEYLLRYSQNANNLRSELGALKYFNATPDEFRALFRATDSLDQQIQQLAGTDPNGVQQRQLLEQQRDDAIKRAVGPDRYKELTQLSDPVYRDSFAAAQQAGTPDAVDTIYQINQATADQQASIRANTNLTDAQKAIELKRVELEQLKANTQAKGQDLPPPETPPLPQDFETPPAPTVRTHPYVLTVGDTLASVAVRYGISLNDLKAANPDYKKLKPGDAIQVPDSLQGN
jgi:LysM repeat protein/uncharacterized protein YdcH (DUF465 family)